MTLDVTGPPGHLNPTLQDFIARELDTLGGLRGRLVAAAGSRAVRSLMVTSGFPGEGKTTNAVLLAAALASSSGERVLLADLNLVNPVLHRLFGVELVPGLADLVLGRAEPSFCLHPVQRAGFDVLTAGVVGRAGGKVLGSSGLGTVMAALQQAYGYVVADASSVMTDPGLLLASACFDGVVLVVRCEETKKDVPPAVRDKIANAGGTLLGVVLNHRRAYLPRSLYSLT